MAHRASPIALAPARTRIIQPMSCRMAAFPIIDIRAACWIGAVRAPRAEPQRPAADVALPQRLVMQGYLALPAEAEYQDCPPRSAWAAPHACSSPPPPIRPDCQ